MIDAERFDEPCGRYQLRLLGCPTLFRGEAEVSLPPSWTRLLGLVVVAGPVSRAEVRGTLWPEASDRQAHGALRTILWRLNRECPGLLSTSGPDVGIERTVFIDVQHVERTAGAVLRGELVDADRDAVNAALRCAEDLMPGSTDAWVLLERERLRQLRLNALESWSRYLIDKGSPVEALAAARAAMRCEPLRESGHRAVLRALLAVGDRGAARRHLGLTVRLLRAELGVGPSPIRGAREGDPGPARRRRCV